jgi:hypothetical protein
MMVLTHALFEMARLEYGHAIDNIVMMMHMADAA